MDEEDWTTLMCSVTTTSSLNGCASTDDINTQVQDTEMVVESMSLDELYQLRGLIDEKGNSLKLNM